MGVHISFVRSVQLDSWSIDQLRVMKVGGNQAAKEFLKDSVSNLDAKSRYQSRQMLQYKQRLQNLVQEDIEKHPDELVLEHIEQEAVAEVKKEDDFFSEWTEPTEVLSKTKSTTLTRMVFKAPFAAAPTATGVPVKESAKVATNFNTPEVPNSSQMEALKSSRPIFENTERAALPMEISQPTTTTSSKKKFGSKKITKGIDFDEAARIAEAEQQRVAAEKAMKVNSAFNSRPNNQSPRMESDSSRASRLSYRDPSEAAPVEKVEQKFQKLGFGFNPADVEKKTDTVVGNKTPVNAVAGKPPSAGFGFAGNPSQSSSADIQRFGNSKSISSDQYFNRGQYNEREQ